MLLLFFVWTFLDAHTAYRLLDSVIKIFKHLILYGLEIEHRTITLRAIINMYIER
jgi:hypothetical protein